MRSVLFLILLALTVVATSLAVQRTHTNIMQEIAATRASLEENIRADRGDRAETDAERIERLFRETIPIYEEMNLEPAAFLARKAAAAAQEIAAAARTGNMSAAAAAHGNIQRTCGECHAQFRQKAPDGSYRFKTQ